MTSHRSARQKIAQRGTFRSRPVTLRALRVQSGPRCSASLGADVGGASQGSSCIYSRTYLPATFDEQVVQRSPQFREAFSSLALSRSTPESEATYRRWGPLQQATIPVSGTALGRAGGHSVHAGRPRTVSMDSLVRRIAVATAAASRRGSVASTRSAIAAIPGRRSAVRWSAVRTIRIAVSAVCGRWCAVSASHHHLRRLRRDSERETLRVQHGAGMVWHGMVVRCATRPVAWKLDGRHAQGCRLTAAAITRWQRCRPTCGETGEPSISVTSLARCRPSLLVPIAYSTY